MARLAAILAALGRALRRDQKSMGSVLGNNFFIVTVLLLQAAGAFLYLIAGLVLLFPLSTDPLRKIPASRLELWPLAKRERWMLRAASPWVNPMTWGLAALAVWSAHGAVSIGLVGLCAGLVASGFVLSSLPIAHGFGVWRRMPNFPGPLNQLVRKNLREILSTLDVYCALLVTVASVVCRLAGMTLPREAFMAITVLVVLALSSYSQCLFGLDGAGGLSRYRLLPLRGWQILAAKDAAFLLVVIVLVLPLAPLAGLGATLVTLAIGHKTTVMQPRSQVRWRFSTGAPVIEGLILAAVMAMAASGIFYSSVLVLIPCVIAWVISMAWYGREMERAFTESADDWGG